MTWQPGQSGNPKGASKRIKPWRNALERALKRLDETAGVPPGTTLERIADVCVSQALDGDKDARKEIAERHDGRVPQPIVGGDDEPPVNVQ